MSPRNLAPIFKAYLNGERRDLTEAFRVYAKQTEQGLEIQNQCAEIKIRAERKAGEILKEMKESGDRDKG